ncbi:diaminopimelate decarboxylase [Reichenbachiella versicolor]|uniref:diaminopimelate decarboxylase n=1 Tax=Reichenbachiella versicolor TaxID=1821036 RepID=UPI000D6E5C75|nr:diaminopimelate decarboxylase [Reichenbachiella versicolor]
MRVKTPFYHYDMELLENTLQALNNAIPSPNFKVHYAIKANAEKRVLELIQKYGFGADCVSGNEVQTAIDTGFNPNEVVLAGVGKSDDELITAISNNIHSINCESIEELEVINEIAGNLNKTADISFRINPNVDAKTHAKITTGLSENKFGIPISEVGRAVEEINKMQHLHLKGIHFHIGSQILSMDPFVKLCKQVNTLLEDLEASGVELEHINVGGGLGIDYLNPEENPIPDFEGYFKTFHQHLKVRDGQTVHFELGRSVVGQCGSLISKVLYIKKGATKNFAIIDAGMTELIRPALYDSYHKIENITADSALGIDNYSVVGPICESSDVFGELEMPITKRGDYLCIKSAGAYGQVLSSNYNLRDKAATVYSDEMSLDECLDQQNAELA